MRCVLGRCGAAAMVMAVVLAYDSVEAAGETTESESLSALLATAYLGRLDDAGVNGRILELLGQWRTADVPALEEMERELRFRFDLMCHGRIALEDQRVKVVEILEAWMSLEQADLCDEPLPGKHLAQEFLAIVGRDDVVKRCREECVEVMREGRRRLLACGLAAGAAKIGWLEMLLGGFSGWDERWRQMLDETYGLYGVDLDVLTGPPEHLDGRIAGATGYDVDGARVGYLERELVAGVVEMMVQLWEIRTRKSGRHVKGRLLPFILDEMRIRFRHGLEPTSTRLSSVVRAVHDRNTMIVRLGVTDVPPVDPEVWLVRYEAKRESDPVNTRAFAAMAKRRDSIMETYKKACEVVAQPSK